MKLFCYSLIKIQIYKGDKDIWIGEESLLRFTGLCFIEKSTELLLKFTSNTKLSLLKTIYLRHRLIFFFYFIRKSWSVLELFSFVSMFNLTYSSPFYFTNQLQLPSKQLWTVYSFPVFWDGLLRWLKMEHVNYVNVTRNISTTLWHCGVVVITTAQLHSTKPELRFCTDSNPACGVSEIWDGKNLWQCLAGNKAKCPLSVNYTTKTIHYHIHHH